MEKKPLLKRILAVSLAAAVTVNGLTFSSLAEDNGAIAFKEVSSNSVSAGLLGEKLETDSGESPYAESDIVRVSIVLKDKSTIENTVDMGYDIDNIAENYAAMSYRSALQDKQANVVNKIEKVTEVDLDVVWNLTLAANIISANVEYGQIEAIEALDEVEEVLIETQYYPDVLKETLPLDPNMATSSEQIGSQMAWTSGYTGAGSRIAVIDTGTDDDHQSFSEAGYLHSLEKLAEAKGKTAQEYIDSLNLLTWDEINSVKDQLNAGTAYNNQSSVAPITEDVYLNAKLPFAYNYVDGDYDTNHDNDPQGEHGSHVAGIATANSWIKLADGSFVKALEYSKALTQGVAPDAQLITMKVFGKGGGAYDSDYMVAIEDAIILKADSINLSLGSGNPGASKSSTKKYQEIFNDLSKSGVVVSISAGNSGYWAENAVNPTVPAQNGAHYLYADDVSMQTDGSPGSFTNALTVASVDNVGSTGAYIQVGDDKIFYNESPNYDEKTGKGYKSLTTLAGEREYVFIDGFGTEADWAAVGDLKGKIAVCQRGSLNFAAKANNAMKAGAAAIIIYDNQAGIINMSAEGYDYNNPYVSISKADGAILKQYAVENGTPITAAAAAAEPVTEAAEADEETEAAEQAEATEAVEAAEAADEAAEADEAAPEDTSAPEETASSEEEAEAPEIAAEPVPQADTVVGYVATLNVSDDYALKGSDEPVTANQTMSSFSSWGVPGTLQLKPEITAPGGNIYSVNGLIAGGEAYENMSGTSMAAPQVAGMSALAAQYVREKKLAEKTGLTPRTLIQSLLMSTATPLVDDYGDTYPVIQQGAGLANINDLINAESYILMDDDASSGAKDGKVKVELGDDPDMKGEYTFGFTVYNLTDSAKQYTLDTKLFTQYIFTYNGIDYMDTATDSLDGYYAEEYTVNGAKANTVTVPANGSVKVTASIKVNVTALEANGYLDGTNGLYIEGYTFVEGAGSAEGAEGTVHSIPVLGFLGNWTDPSMFDLGTYTDYIKGEESRTPYVVNSQRENVFGIEYSSEPGSTYYLTGANPVVRDAAYMEERSAINGNDLISLVQFTAIRNAANSRLAFINETNPEKSEAMEAGAVNAAFYYANQGKWMYTTNSLNIGTTLSQLGFKNGDRATVQFSLAPEYYVDDSGEETVTAWDQLGEGASFGLSLTVDNIKPEIVRISLEEDGTVLRVAARDNQYIAGVVLYNKTGDVIVSLTGSKPDAAPNELGAYMLSLDGVKGTEFLVQVIDYANNVSTYKFAEEIGGDLPAPDMLALSYTGSGTLWNTINPIVLDVAETDRYAGCPVNFDAATIVDHYIFAVDEDGDFYVMSEDDVYSYVRICNLGMNISDLAYNPQDKQIYGVSDYNTLVKIDKLTGEVTEITNRLPDTVTLACSNDGVFYANYYETGMIYAFSMDNPNRFLILPVDYTEDFGETYGPQSMEVDPNTNNLCWTSMFREYSEEYSEMFSELYGVELDVYIYMPLYFEIAIGEIDFDNRTVEYYYEENISYLSEKKMYLGFDDDGPYGLDGQYYGLIITDKTTDLLMYDFNGDGKTDAADGQALLDYRTGVLDEISNEANKDVDGDGDFDTHDAYVLLNTILWSEPTSEVHSVNISNSTALLLTGGTYQLSATVTPWTTTNRSVNWSSSDTSVATVDSNGLVTARGVGECVITASSTTDSSISAECEITVEALTVTLSGALQDTDGNPTFYKWNIETDSTWTPTVAINRLGGEILSSAVDAQGNVYIADSNEIIHKIDPATGEDIDSAEGFGYSDMTYSTVFSTASEPKVAGVYGTWLLSPDDPMNLGGMGRNLSQYGASTLVAIASLGYDAVELQGTLYEGEAFMAVDINGTIWDILLTTSGGMLYGSIPNVFPASIFGTNNAGEYCSLVCGDDGNLYLAAYDGNTSNLYRIAVDANGDFVISGFGNVGDGVWPTTINSVVSNTPAARAYADTEINVKNYKYVPAQEEVYSADNAGVAVQSEEAALEDIVPVTSLPKLSSVSGKTLEVMASGSAVSTYAAEDEGEDTPAAGEENETASEAVISGDTLDVELKVHENSEPIESSNGLFVVRYSPEAVEFTGLEPEEGVYNSCYDEEEGVLIIGFASALYTIPEDQPDQIANFKILDEELAKNSPIEVIELESGSKNYINRVAPVVVKISSLTSEDIDEIVELYEEYAGIELKEVLQAVEAPDEPDVPTPPTPDSSDTEPSIPVPVVPSVPSGSFTDPDTTTAAEATEATTAAPANTTAPADNNNTASGDNSGSGNGSSGTSDNNTGNGSGDVNVDTTAPVGDNGTSGGSDANNTDNSGANGSGSDSNVGNTNDGTGSDKNQNTGVALVIAPAAISALAVLASKKKFRK